MYSICFVVSRVAIKTFQFLFSDEQKVFAESNEFKPFHGIWYGLHLWFDIRVACCVRAGETPSRTLAETATERARETALAAKEKAKDLASHAQKKQYVWWALVLGLIYLFSFLKPGHLVTDPSHGWMETIKSLSWVQEIQLSLLDLPDTTSMLNTDKKSWIWGVE